MRSDLLLKLTRNKSDQEQFKDVELTGPHDYVLMEMRREEQQERPDLTKVTAGLVNMDEKLFMLAVKRLQDRGLIEGAVIEVSETGMPVSIQLAKARLTNAGIEYEKRLG